MKITLSNIFLWTGRLEGSSLLILLFIAMPVKYLMGEPVGVRIVGALHGGLFMLYIYLLVNLSSDQSWSWKKTLKGFILSSVPFGTFYFERTEKF